ncbi:amino acid ABC transporter substrate-binding protein [Sinorhizobium fredii]|uniref:amino acid ABC transporter substrate-binding protein n=1 Tax=Rhizobium fredii TaxID=380 RepID=UPI0005956AF8|nr:amino acid ABC transporter substrate-binding protein [Sinorhizobium fredii]WOS61999.1 amino acid ABC transporter substrate-binding protein [Sinorhizobium fredii GR64]
MNNNVIATAMTAAMLALISTAAESAEPLDGTLKKVAETGEIVVSYRDAAVPFSYIDGDQKPLGYALDICLKVVEDIKAELKMPDLHTRLQLVSGANRIPLLLNGTIDLECGTTTNSVERQKQVAFSLSYFVAGTRILTKKDSGISGLEDLKGKTVASNAGSTGLRQLTDINTQKAMEINITPGRDLAETFLLLETDRADAVVQDDILLTGMAARSRAPADYQLVGDALSIEPYGVMFRRDDPQLKAAVDKSIRKMLESGEIASMYKKWFEQPIPPQGINLNFPPSDHIRRAWEHPSDSADPADYR